MNVNTRKLIQRQTWYINNYRQEKKLRKLKLNKLDLNIKTNNKFKKKMSLRVCLLVVSVQILSATKTVDLRLL